MRVKLKQTTKREPVLGRNVLLYDANDRPLDSSDVLDVTIAPFKPNEVATVTVTYTLHGLGDVE